MANATIKFVQGVNTPPAGQALQGVTGTLVACSNGDDVNVVTWRWEMIDVPPGSAVPVGVMSLTSTTSFTPDHTAGYLVRLTTTDNLGNTYVDERAVLIPEDSIYSRIIAPFRALSGALNVGGQTRGWAKYMEPYLYLLNRIRDVAPTAPTNLQGLLWNAANNRYEPNTLSAAIILAGDVTGAAGANQVGKVTGIAGTLAMAATAAALVWAAATTAPSISQATATAGVGQPTSITAQAAFPTGGGAGGNLSLGGGAGDGGGAHGSVLLKTGPTTLATFAPEQITLGGGTPGTPVIQATATAYINLISIPNIYIDANVHNWRTGGGVGIATLSGSLGWIWNPYQVATIAQTPHATTPHTLTIQAQNVTTGTGSDLVLQSGTGSAAIGAVSIKAGNVEGLRVVAAASANNVVGILGGNNLGTSYCLTAGGYPGFETSNAAVWLLPQGTARTAGNLSLSADATSTSFGAASILYFGVGATNYMRMRSTEFVLGTSYGNPQYILDFSTTASFHFAANATVSASIVYDGVSSATPGKTLTISGQNGGTSGVQAGGAINVISGAGFGGGVAGNIVFANGSVATPTLTLSPSTASTGDYRVPATWALVSGNGGDRPVIKIDGSNNIIVGSTGGVIGVIALRSQSSLDITTSVINATTAASASIYVETLAAAYTRVWDSGCTSISLSQATHATVAHTFTIQAGNTTTGVGSNLLLQSGKGSTNGGAVRIQIGDSGTPGAPLTMIEAAQVTGTNFVVALAVKGDLTTTMMPANTGDGVVHVHNCATPPTANAVGGGVLYAIGGALMWRGSGGTVTTLGAA